MLPKHIGIIMDGNRRFAREMMKKPWEGHKFGLKKVRQLLEWCRDLGIKYVTLYAFSLENFKRPKKEFKMIMDIFKGEFRNIIKNEKHDVHRYKIKVRVIGKKERLSKTIQTLIQKVEKLTSNYNHYFLNLAIAYSGRAEIIDACKKISNKIITGDLSLEDINERNFKQYLYTNGFPDPDLIIRTSEQRVSGFLLWQSAYSELIFIPKLFPKLTKKDFVKAIEDYEKHERRFGR